jgi:hypothetical protein
MKLINSDIFPMPQNPHILHLGSIQSGMHEYILMKCIHGRHQGKVYIEEVVLNSVNYSEDVFANLKYISDDNVAKDLAAFVQEKGLLNPMRELEYYLQKKSSFLNTSMKSK